MDPLIVGLDGLSYNMLGRFDVNFPYLERVREGGYTSPTSSYEHRYRGIFAAHGPLFESGEFQDMSIIDVLPTVLAALGEKVSPEFDGKARTDLLSTSSEPQQLNPSELPTPRMRGETSQKREERDAVVEERLSDLGYMN